VKFPRNSGRWVQVLLPAQTFRGSDSQEMNGAFHDEETLSEYGVTLKRGSAATKRLKDARARAGFDSFENTVYLKKNATAYDAFHELQHIKHRAALALLNRASINDDEIQSYITEGRKRGRKSLCHSWIESKSTGCQRS